MVRPADGAVPLPDGEVLDLPVLVAVGRAGLAGREEGRNLPKFAAVHGHLVPELAEELAPPDVGYGFRELLVLLHAPDVQVLHGDETVLPCEARRQLVEEVAPAILDALMHSGDGNPRLLVVAGPRHRP